MKGYTVNPDGTLNYSFKSVEKALGYTVDGSPSMYEKAGQIAREDGNLERAANMYLAASLVSAGLSRTLAYESEAERLAK